MSRLLALIATLIVLSACSPAAAPATEASSSTGGTTGGEATADWSTVKSAAHAGGMDALVAAAKAEGELNVITLPRDWCNYGVDTFSQKYGIMEICCSTCLLDLANPCGLQAFEDVC